MTSFLGWTPSTEVTANYEDIFEEIYHDAGEAYLITKKTYISEADGDIPGFEYKYGIRIIDTGTYNDSHSIGIELTMVILPEYFCPSMLSRICEETCVENAEGIWLYDLISQPNYYSISFGYEENPYDPKNLPDEWYDFHYYPLECTKVKGILNVAASVLDAINSTRGFNLDKCWNTLGTTGWDTMRQILLDENQIDATLKRYKEQRGA